MRFLADKKLIFELTNLKNKLLMNPFGEIMVISDFTIEEEKVQRGGFLSRKRTVTDKYITSLTVIAYSRKLSAKGGLSEEHVERILTFGSFTELRTRFEVLKEHLKAFGFEITKINKPTE